MSLGGWLEREGLSGDQVSLAETSILRGSEICSMVLNLIYCGLLFRLFCVLCWGLLLQHCEAEEPKICQTGPTTRECEL